MEEVPEELPKVPEELPKVPEELLTSKLASVLVPDATSTVTDYLTGQSFGYQQ